MTTDLATISPDTGQPVLCGACGARLTCEVCTVDDVVQSARRTLAEVVRSRDPGRNAMARVAACKVVMAKDFLAYLTDEELVAEVKRRSLTKKKAKHA